MDHLFPYQDDTSYLVGDTAVEYLLSLPPTASHKNACIINIMAVMLIAKTKVKHGLARVLTNKLYFGILQCTVNKADNINYHYCCPDVSSLNYMTVSFSLSSV